jgi:hypothetical protein
MLTSLRLLVLAVLTVLPVLVSAQPRPEEWRLRQDLRFGSIDDPETAFAQVLDLEIHPSGDTIYVLEFGSPTIRVLDLHGRVVHTIGRRGHGPGELQSPRRLGWRGDTLWVQDPSLRRLTFFRADGAFIGQHHFVVPAPAPHLSELAPGVPTADGRLAVIPGARTQLRPSAVRQLAPILQVTREGRVVRTVGTVETPRVALVHLSPGYTSGVQPFADHPLAAVARDGRSHLIVSRRAATAQTSANATFAVTRLSLDGDTLHSRQYRYAPVPLTRAMRDSVVLEHARIFTNDGQARPVRSVEQAIRESFFFPDFVPPIAAMLAGTDGTLWLQRAADRWIVFDEDGGLVASVTVPSHLKLLRASGTEVWASYTDELDVPMLGRFRVLRR